MGLCGLIEYLLACWHMQSTFTHAQMQPLNAYIHPPMWAHKLMCTHTYTHTNQGYTQQRKYLVLCFLNDRGVINGGASVFALTRWLFSVVCFKCACDCVVNREGSKDGRHHPPSLWIKDIKNQTCQSNYRQESEECCDLNWAWHHVQGPMQLIYPLRVCVCMCVCTRGFWPWCYRCHLL